jgi:fructan beta-fructosidase
MKFPEFLLLACIPLFHCTYRQETISDDSGVLEKYRPLIHFSPSVNWTNDPNGLVYYHGEYHLFYQYNPYGTQWGHMSWGHAVSENLFDWTHLPVAIFETGSFMIFSGSAVIDTGNTCNFCPAGTPDCMIAVYTAHLNGKAQYQNLAWSSDSGITWNQYVKNPILDLGKKDFRDPKVFKYGDGWRMVVSLPQEYKVLFYKSDDLVQWIKTGEFGKAGDTSKIWECPDLVEVPEDGSNEKSAWVLFISSGSPYGPSFTGMQYFVGNFDGNTFRPESTHAEPRWLDYGKDFYAAITYNNLPQGIRPILIGWVNNWTYANDLPTLTWRGMMSVPRELNLVKLNNDLYLSQRPVVIPTIHLDSLVSLTNQLLADNEKEITGMGRSCIIDFEATNRNALEFGVRVFRGKNESTKIGYNERTREYFIDRSHSGNVAFNKQFPTREYALAKTGETNIKLHIILDQSVVEVFAENGLTVLTEQVFPAENESTIRFYALNGTVSFNKIDLIRIKP